MLWDVEIRPVGRDADRDRVRHEFDLLTQADRGATLVAAAARGYLLDGVSEDDARRLTDELLFDPIVETAAVTPVGGGDGVTILLKPGVMDPVSESVLRAAADLGIALTGVRTYRRYTIAAGIDPADKETLFRKVLANDAIEQIVVGPVTAGHLSVGKPYTFRKVIVPLLTLDAAGLVALSKHGQLALTLEEMQTIQAHFAGVGRDPTDAELESIAQTWSEHCSHKTLKGTIDYTEVTAAGRVTKRFANLLKETVFAATQTIRTRLGPADWCVSVFADNAGVVTFDAAHHVCIKVETHNHPSAIEPYGGANTGLGGVIRDPLGTGLGAKPVCNTDVFCFARPDFPPGELPAGVLHPRRVLHGVVAGVRDYGNRMGIPTVNGAILFDDRFLANPLVFCGTVGLIPVGMEHKTVSAGELIVAVGGRTGRDGIHGATFSSLELTAESDAISGGAVQIGNAIAEKKVMDVILQARDRRLYSAITDCGAGGFSSAVGEMAADLGAVVRLDAAPLKYAGLSYTEIWISESQERMVLAVPPADWPALEALCRGEDVEAAVIGEFQATGRLRLEYAGEIVADVDMHFLHDGRPNTAREAVWHEVPVAPAAGGEQLEPGEALMRILGTYTVASKEWVVRQYDHEVQGGSVIKPLVGVRDDGPGDASVVMPVLGNLTGFAVGCGLNPRFADLDPAAAAACAIDEAVRNVVAVGADPSHTAILDNFCWGNVNDPAVLGALVRTAVACRTVAEAFGTPFVSGKDSLNNTYVGPDGARISIPHTLLITALGRVPDVRQCVTMDLKRAGNHLYLVGVTRADLGGSHYHLVCNRTGGTVPDVDIATAPKVFAAVHAAVRAGLVRACHDLSEGGLAVAAAEMAFAGEVGVDLRLDGVPAAGELADSELLFSESPTRFLIEAEPANAAALAALFPGLPFAKVGTTTSEQRLRVAGTAGEWVLWAKLAELKEAWQKPLRLS